MPRKPKKAEPSLKVLLDDPSTRKVTDIVESLHETMAKNATAIINHDLIAEADYMVVEVSAGMRLSAMWGVNPESGKVQLEIVALPNVPPNQWDWKCEVLSRLHTTYKDVRRGGLFLGGPDGVHANSLPVFIIDCKDKKKHMRGIAEGFMRLREIQTRFGKEKLPYVEAWSE